MSYKMHNIHFERCFAIVILVSQHNISDIFYQRLMSDYIVGCLKALHKAAPSNIIITRRHDVY